MGAGEGAAARILGRLEFHDFDARVVWIVEIELPLTIASQLGFFDRFPAIGDELFFRGSNVGDAQGNVIHDAARMVVRIRRYAPRTSR